MSGVPEGFSRSGWYARRRNPHIRNAHENKGLMIVETFTMMMCMPKGLMRFSYGFDVWEYDSLYECNRRPYCSGLEDHGSVLG